MNNPFPLNDLPNGTWSVTWPEFTSIKETGLKERVMKTVFGELDYDEVGFGIALVNDETDILWMNSDVWYSAMGDSYAIYLEDMYELRGLVFRTMDEAKKMQDWLEKKYMWEVLNA
jgi:hypothetical protein